MASSKQFWSFRENMEACKALQASKVLTKASTRHHCAAVSYAVRVLQEYYHKYLGPVGGRLHAQWATNQWALLLLRMRSDRKTW